VNYLDARSAFPIPDRSREGAKEKERREEDEAGSTFGRRRLALSRE
jgi:hypothetical protein